VIFRVRIDPAAERKLRRIDKQLIAEIVRRIHALADNPRPPGCKQLKDSTRGGWRFRVGKYRVLYVIDEDHSEVQVYDIDLRDRVYRRRR